MTYDDFRALLEISAKYHSSGEFEKIDYKGLHDIQVFRYIWMISRAENKFTAMLQYMNLTQSQFARDFGIPLRTVQNWAGGQSKATDWTLPLILYAATEYLSV